jgi:hypothetical protein
MGKTGWGKVGHFSQMGRKLQGQSDVGRRQWADGGDRQNVSPPINFSFCLPGKNPLF